MLHGRRARSESAVLTQSAEARYHRFRTLAEWKEYSKQEQHSLFADPKFVKPVPPIDRWDWRVRPDSPNIGKGENGTTIGATAVAR